ncbi:glycosyl hydrolase family 39 [Curtobacterium sp. PhB172]|nr:MULTISPECIES: hypothetical protein [unclassified Curtobacterium]ROS45839.1 glycosyl hydrolase family 39 [Curtobacterium sp. PhB131]ROS65392.1 glycosyl hydrolase family 39 [Curtobacterium sp. PhB172]ROQ17738.1 glycosyl hydrolase family 39 [Curtobacterium sp. PhB171]ROQ29017.1 glycosyl hydrolase family 39 [Curtobacterium sp. PhB170]ROS67859.1 glycosyl hydrolase family 39 [Curtobacterium sp. PhB141]
MLALLTAIGATAGAESVMHRTAHADTAAVPTVRATTSNGLFTHNRDVRFAAAGIAPGTAWRVTDTNGAVVVRGAVLAGTPTASVDVWARLELGPGLYRLTVDSSPAATTRFVVTTERAERDPSFGLAVGGNPGPVAEALPTLDALGAGSYRQDLQWTAVEKQPGTFDFGPTDARVDALVAERSMHPLFVLDYGHPAYTASAMSPPDVSDPVQAAAWTRYVDAAVRHMRARYPEADRSFEVWNEWKNNHGALPSDPASYIALGELTARTIRVADPDARIVGPTENAVSDSERAWLAEWLDLGGADHVDAVSIHPYNEPWAPEHCVATNPCIEDALRWLRAEVDAHPRADGTTLPIWISEVGWPTAGAAGVPTGDQAAFVVRTQVLAAQYGVERVFTFEMSAPDRVQGDGTYRAFGLTERPSLGYEPKPAAAAYATMQRTLAGMHYAADLRTGDVRQVRFDSADGRRHVRVVWQTADRFATRSVQVALPGGGTLTEAYGASRSVTGANGRLSMSATWMPRFVSWHD